MRITRVLLSKGLIFGLAVLFVGESALVPVSAHAQAGENAVFNGPSPTNTSAFIDAANFSSGGDICSQLHAVLNSTSTYIQKTNWQVIDARGIVGSSLLCSSMDSNPWAGLSASRRNWDTILLPAGTIKIYSTWTLPQYTRIIGEGPGITILQAASGFSGPMIQMGCLATTVGTTCGLSFGVSVENLTLDAQSQAIDGIDNSDAEEQSYVKHVQMINIGGTGGGTGLSLGIDAANNSKSNHSGPYSDISITETSSGSACINVAPSAQPRGLHGINCLCPNSGSVCSSSNTSPGIYLDGSNVSLEDVNINGFGDGIRIGSQGSSGTVESDVMFNVTGGGNVTNLIHICGLNYGSHSACSQTSNSVVDLTLMGV